MIRLLILAFYLVASSAWAQDTADPIPPAADVPDESVTESTNEPVANTSPSPADLEPRAVFDDRGVTLDLDATSVTGNRELPKVLYIVPWKKAELGDLTGRPIGSLLDEVIEPIDPEVFRRQLDYYQDAISDEDATSSVNSDVSKSREFADNSQ